MLVADGDVTSSYSPTVGDLQHVVSVHKHRITADDLEVAVAVDVAELEVKTDVDGDHLQIQPKVVDAGHHARRLLRLTGLDVVTAAAPVIALLPVRR